jgi:Fe-S-cluster containining protein
LERQENHLEVCKACETGCCRDARPPITSKRRRIIERYLEEQKLRIEDPFVCEDYTYPREDKEGYCIFYNRETKKCLVHVVKPETCVAGPITFDINKEDKVIEWYLKMEKICPLAGVMFRNRSLLQQHFKAARREILRLVDDLPSYQLKVILRREEPETFKIGEEKAGDNVLSKLDLL